MIPFWWIALLLNILFALLQLNRGRHGMALMHCAVVLLMVIVRG